MGIERELVRQWSKIWKAQERRKRLGKPVTGQFGAKKQTGEVKS